MKENIVKGRYYRILTDELNRIWDRISFWTSSSDVEFEDGMTAEQKVGQIRGITSSMSSNNENMAFSAKGAQTLATSINTLNTIVTNTSNTWATSTLTAGATTITLYNANFHSTSVVDIYNTKYGLSALSALVGEGYMTLTYEAQTENVSIRVKIVNV